MNKFAARVENSAFEYGTTEEALPGFRLDNRGLKTFGVSQGTTADNWVSEGLTKKALTPYFGPTDEELRTAVEFLALQAGQHGVAFAAAPRHEAAWTDFAHALFNAKEFIFVP